MRKAIRGRIIIMRILYDVITFNFYELIMNKLNCIKRKKTIQDLNKLETLNRMVIPRS